MVDFAALRKKANERAAIERGNAHTERIVRRKTQKELLDEMYSAMEEGALSFNAWEQDFITSCRGYLRSRTLQDGLSFKQRTCLGEMVIKYSIDPEIVIQEGTKPQPATPRDYSDLDDNIPF